MSDPDMAAEWWEHYGDTALETPLDANWRFVHERERAGYEGETLSDELRRYTDLAGGELDLLHPPLSVHGPNTEVQ